MPKLTLTPKEVAQVLADYAAGKLGLAKGTPFQVSFHHGSELESVDITMPREDSHA